MQWKIDPAHTSAEFTVRHMMITNVRGKFEKLDGVVSFNPDNLAASSVSVTIDAASINTGAADRDNHLRSADFFDVENYPHLTFRSTRVEMTGDSTARITGDLTIRDVTRPVTIEAEFLGQNTSPFGTTVAGFSGTARINREDFGLTWNMALETGGVLVGKDISIELQVQAVLEGAAAAV
jgi:polyisoprenoid-binding protein YceI